MQTTELEKKEIKVIIGDESEEFGRSYCTDLRRSGIYASIQIDDGLLLLDVVREEKPDVVIMKAVMPGIDALELIERVSADSFRPFFIVAAPYHSEYIEKQIMAFENAYFIRMPSDTKMVEHIIRNATSHSMKKDFLFGGSNDDKCDMELIVTEIIQRLGIPANLKGYRYAREAIIRTIDDEDLSDNITKTLYPIVARSFDTTPSRVERAIRNSIEIAWERGSLSTMLTFSSKNEKPTNAEFIALIADNLRLKYMRVLPDRYKSKVLV